MVGPLTWVLGFRLESRGVLHRGSQGRATLTLC